MPRSNLSKWAYDLHNKVNDQLGKPRYSESQHLKDYHCSHGKLLLNEVARKCWDFLEMCSCVYAKNKEAFGEALRLFLTYYPCEEAKELLIGVFQRVPLSKDSQTWFANFRSEASYLRSATRRRATGDTRDGYL